MYSPGGNFESEFHLRMQRKGLAAMMAGSEKKRLQLTLPGSQQKNRGQNVILRCLMIPKREPYGGII